MKNLVLRLQNDAKKDVISVFKQNWRQEYSSIHFGSFLAKKQRKMMTSSNFECITIRAK